MDVELALEHRVQVEEIHPRRNRYQKFALEKRSEDSDVSGVGDGWRRLRRRGFARLDPVDQG